MTDPARDIARDLLRIHAVSLRPLDPFTWASGRRSPVYTDNRLTLGYPDVRGRLVDYFEAVATPLEPDVIVGTATAGIPHAAWLAERMGLPMAYVRSSAKSHGTMSQVEGVVREGDRAVVIEDLVSTGGSSIAAVNALTEVGAKVAAVLAVFTYGFGESVAAFADAKLHFESLTDFRTLIDVAHADGTLTDAEIGALRSWHRNPIGWSDANSADSS